MRHRLLMVLANAILLLVSSQIPSVAQDRPPAQPVPSITLPAAPALPAAQDRPQAQKLPSMAPPAQPSDQLRAELALKLLRPLRLTFSKVHAPAINCVFNTACMVTVTDSVGDIPMPADVTGTGRLQSRTFAAAAGSPAAGNTAYLYRVDMTQAVSAGEAPCVTDFTIDFGPIVKSQYDGSGPLDDGFVVVQGGLGTIGILEATKTGNSIAFIFDQPVCAGPTPGTGHTTYFFGLAATGAPKPVLAKVGWPGLLPLDVHARAPNH